MLIIHALLPCIKRQLRFVHVIHFHADYARFVALCASSNALCLANPLLCRLYTLPGFTLSVNCALFS